MIRFVPSHRPAQEPILTFGGLLWRCCRTCAAGQKLRTEEVRLVTPSANDVLSLTKLLKCTFVFAGMRQRNPLFDDFSRADMNGAEGEDFEDETDGGNGATCGMFGSLLWSQADLLGSAIGTSSSSSRAGKRELTRNRESQRVDGGENKHGSEAGGQSHSIHSSNNKESKEHSLVQGLKPMRDKYLLGVLAKMSAPIAQMFPELEGYTGACNPCFLFLRNLLFSFLIILLCSRCAI